MFWIQQVCVVGLASLFFVALAMAQGKTYNVLDYGANAVAPSPDVPKDALLQKNNKSAKER